MLVRKRHILQMFARFTTYSELIAEVILDAVCSKCEVLSETSIQDSSEHEPFNHVFFCSCIFDPKKGTIKQVSSVFICWSSSLCRILWITFEFLFISLLM